MISDPKQKIFHKYLITSKYEALFLNKDIESYTLTNNFNLPNNPYAISNLIKEVLNIEPNLYSFIKNSLCNKIASNEIYEMLEISDFDYSNIDTASVAVIRGCMIKSCLVYMNDKQINELNNMFHDYIEDKEYDLIHPNSKVSESIIINCFKNVKRDKTKIRILSSK